MKSNDLTVRLPRLSLAGIPLVLLAVAVLLALAALLPDTRGAQAQSEGAIPAQAPGLQVSIAASSANPRVNEPVTLTATIANGPSEETPAYNWEIDFGSWVSFGGGSTFRYGNGKAETLRFRLTVSYDSGESATSDPIAVTWVAPEPTAEPTAAPTPEPTEEPTQVPTPEPTQEPTPEATEEPTQEPTQEPTSEPTPEPTQEPTASPTSTPTPEPTPEPTPIPTPSVTGVEVSSSPTSEDTYLLGETIQVTLTFSEKVTVTGAPRLRIDMDPAHWGEKPASYDSGSGTADITFTHTVVEPNYSTRGIAVLANSLELNGGTIRSSATQADADLSHIRLEHNASHKVDWQRARPNRAPAVNTDAENYDRFTGDNNAPRGVLVSKPFYQVFTDPDDDELTYSVSITAGDSSLVEELVVTLDKNFQPDTRGWPPIGTYDRVFFQAEGESDWKAITPQLPHRPVVTVTLTATDPDGLSASVNGDFVLHWETYPEVVSAVGSEQAIALTFDMEVEDDPAPTAGQFTVKVVRADGSGGTVDVSEVSVSGSVVALELATELVSGQTVKVDYAYAFHTPLRAADGWGDPAPWFYGQAVDMSLLNPLEQPSNLEVVAEPGSKALLATWDEVESATSYKLRWRQSGGEFETDNAVTASDTIWVVTVSDYGRWEVQVQACNDAGCGPEAAATVDVVRAASLRLERAVDPEGNVRSRTLTASWDRVEGAASYSLSWQRLGDDSQPNAQAQAQSAAGVRQARSVSAASLSSGQDVDDRTSNQLTFGAEETGAEFTVPDDGAYRAEFRALSDDNKLIAVASNQVNEAPGQPDTTAPRLLSGEIDGETMTLYFSEALDEDSVGCCFEVTLDYGDTRIFFATVSRKAKISGNKVVVFNFFGRDWMHRARVGVDVWVYYYKDDGEVVPAGKRLRDLAGNEVWTPYRTLHFHTPRTPTIRLYDVTEPPLLQRATAHPHWLTLNFNERLYGNSVPASAFTVTINGSAVNLASVEPVAVSGDTVRLVLASAVSSSDVVTVSYAEPSVNKIWGEYVAAKSFSGRSVTNRVGVVPSVSQVAITSTPADGEAYATGETVQVSLTFTEAVTVDTTDGAPRLRIKLDPAYGEKWADYSGGSGTATLTFGYTVAEPDRSTRGVAVLRDSLDLNGGAIRSVATPQQDAHRWYPGRDHDAGHMVDWRRSAPGVPWVTGVAITSDPGADGVYAQGDSIQVTATFSKAVNVDTTGGAPRLKIRIAPPLRWMKVAFWFDWDDAERWADYTSGSGTAELTFEYTVLGVNRSTQGVAVLGNGLELNGGAIRSTDATPVNANLRYGELRHDRNHQVDGKTPVLLDVAVAGTKVSAAFDEALDGDAVPPASAFTVKRTPQEGSEETVSLSGSPTITAGAVLLTLAEPVLATDTDVKVSYAKPTAAGASKLRDRAGNEAASFTDRAVEATDTTPPRLVWGQIDGDLITLYFSEHLDEDSVSKVIWKGDIFRLTLDYKGNWRQDGQCPSVDISFSARPREVYVSGNALVVDGLSHSERRRASVDWTLIMFYYIADTAVTQRLRDLSGNPVSTPHHRGDSHWETRIIHLENVTRLPYPRSATVNGSRLALTFSAPMDRGWVPAASAFTVKVNGSAVSLASANPVSVSGRDLTLTLAAAVASTDTVTVSYDKPESRPLRNVVCEYAPSFTDNAVTNATP